MIKKSLVTLVLFGVLTNSVFAGDRIQDPKKLLVQADKFLGNVSFEQAFMCGDRAQLERTDCMLECDPESGGNSCQEACQPSVLESTQVTVCDGQQVVLQTESASGDLSEDVITREEYVAGHGNFLRIILNRDEGLNSDSFVSIERTDAFNFQTRNQGVVKGLKVYFSYHVDEDGEKYEIPMMIALGKGIPSIAQVLLVHTGVGTITTPNVKLLGYSRN